MSHHRSFKDRTPCEKFIARVLGVWSGIGDTEGQNRNIYMSNLRITHNPRDPGNIGQAVLKSQTSDPDDRIALNFAAYFKCDNENRKTNPRDISFIVHHQTGEVEIVKGKVENEDGTAATMESEERDDTGNSSFLMTKHRWFFDEKRVNDTRTSTASLRKSNTNNNRPEYDINSGNVRAPLTRSPPPSAEGGNQNNNNSGWSSWLGGNNNHNNSSSASDVNTSNNVNLGSGISNDLYVDDEVLIRHFWVATEHLPELQLVQRTKFTTAHHVGGSPNRAALSQMSANAGFC